MMQAIAFDCFGTLVGFGVRRNPYAMLVGDREPRQARRMIMTREVSMASLARERGLEHRLGELRAGLNDELAGLFVYVDVAAALAKLHAAGTCVAVCSNLASDYGPSVRRLLPAVSDFIFSYEVGAVKPDPEIYQHVCDRLRVPASAVLFIGDSRRCDFDGPRAFGMQAALLDRLSGETIHSKLPAHFP